MRAIVVLCLLAAASGDKLGYNYSPVGHSDSGLSFIPGGGAVSGGGFNLGAGTAVAPSHSAPVHSQIEKEFYTFTANDEDFEEPAASEQIANSLKQNIRVIFIKAPENRGLERAVLGLAKQASEQKTAIYVLHKQQSIGDLANQFNAARSDNNQKPEVHFVKYHTPEDAAHAQHIIQSQYDSLGGTSQSFNGGVAPVLNFASQGGHHGGHHTGGGFGSVGGGGFNSGGGTGFGSIGSGGLSSIGSGSASNVNYLPPSIRRRFRL